MGRPLIVAAALAALLAVHSLSAPAENPSPERPVAPEPTTEPSSPEGRNIMCFPEPLAHMNLSGRGEKLAGAGRSYAGRNVYLYRNEDTGTWAILERGPVPGTLCLINAGPTWVDPEDRFTET